MKLGFVGGGVMAEAILAGVLKDRSMLSGQIVISDVVERRRDYLKSQYGVDAVADNSEVVARVDLAVLAVKPQNLGEIFRELKGKARDGLLVVSIVAGATMDTLTDGLGNAAVIRAMPNTPGQIGAGITVWTSTAAVTEKQRGQAERVLSTLGRQVMVADEKLIDMATALSASGPAYVFLFIEALIDAGVYLGMGRDLAQELAVQTVLGSATMVSETGEHPRSLRDMVTSPGGTTAEALLALEKGEFRATVMNAVIAAYDKACKLGAQGN